MKNILIIFTIALFFTACDRKDAKYHQDQVSQDEKAFTLGTIQSRIKKGMSSAEVIEVLGSPNVVSTDDESREVWVYDKISTNKSVSASSSSNAILPILTAVGLSNSSAASSTSQKTLTSIIKFDKNSKVRDVSYHSSKF